MRSTALLMLAAAVFGSSLAIAQSNLSDGSRATSKSVPPALSTLSARWEAADKDGDGALTAAEAQAGGLSHIVKHFDRLDADGNGKVTPDEMRALLLSRPLT